MREEVILNKESALMLCDALDINSSLFDEENEEYILLKRHNPMLLELYEDIFTLSCADY